MHEWETTSLKDIDYVLNRTDINASQPLLFYILRDRKTYFGHVDLTGANLR